MARRFQRRRRVRRLDRAQVVRLVPNMITVTALCVGLSSLRFAVMTRWDLAVTAILIAAILDVMDGQLARVLGSTTDFGAELDSLSDFVNFGVAPAVINYLFILHHWQGIGWAVVLLFATCTALRLARFNVHRLTATDPSSLSPSFFTGVPAPAGAFLALWPLMMMLSSSKIVLPVFVFAAFMGGGALLMISRIPTFSIKNLRLSQRWMPSFLIGVALFAALFLSAPWATLCALGFVYLASVPWSLWLHYRRNRTSRSLILYQNPAEWVGKN